MEKKELDNIELRSEKVRNVICKDPPRLVCFGTVVITIVVLVLAAAFVPVLQKHIKANVRIIVSNKALLQQVSG